MKKLKNTIFDSELTEIIKGLGFVLSEKLDSGQMLHNRVIFHLKDIYITNYFRCEDLREKDMVCIFSLKLKRFDFISVLLIKTEPNLFIDVLKRFYNYEKN
jgi:hypothetical protein